MARTSSKTPTGRRTSLCDDLVKCDVAVIATVFNTRELLRQLLDSVRKQVTSLSIETVVTDNASQDGVTEMIARDFPWVHFFRNEKNIGQVKALNATASTANAEFLMFCHADVVLESNVIEGLVSFLQDHPVAGVVAPNLYLPDGSPFSLRIKFPTIWSQIRITVASLAKTFTGRRFTFLTYRRGTSCTGRVEFVWTPTVMIRAELFKSLGGFDTDLFSWKHMQDFCWRAKESRWESWYYGNVSAMHYDVQTPKEFGQGATNYKRDFKVAKPLHDRDLMTFYRKHYSAVEVMIFRLCLFLLAASGTIRGRLVAARNRLFRRSSRTMPR